MCEQIQVDLGRRVGQKARIRFQNVNGVGLLTDADFGCVLFDETEQGR